MSNKKVLPDSGKFPFFVFKFIFDPVGVNALPTFYRDVGARHLKCKNLIKAIISYLYVKFIYGF